MFYFSSKRHCMPIFFFCFEGRGIKRHVGRVHTWVWCSIVMPGWRCRGTRSRAPHGGCKSAESQAGTQIPSLPIQILYLRREESTGVQNVCLDRTGKACEMSYGLKCVWGLSGYGLSEAVQLPYFTENVESHFRIISHTFGGYLLQILCYW